MTTVQLILPKARSATYDRHGWPIVLQFGGQKTRDEATLFIPAFAFVYPRQQLAESRAAGGTKR